MEPSGYGTSTMAKRCVASRGMPVKLRLWTFRMMATWRFQPVGIRRSGYGTGVPGGRCCDLIVTLIGLSARSSHPTGAWSYRADTAQWEQADKANWQC